MFDISISIHCKACTCYYRHKSRTSHHMKKSYSIKSFFNIFQNSIGHSRRLSRYLTVLTRKRHHKKSFVNNKRQRRRNRQRPTSKSYIPKSTICRHNIIIAVRTSRGSCRRPTPCSRAKFLLLQPVVHPAMAKAARTRIRHVRQARWHFHQPILRWLF